jgi:glycerol-3-phosphate acyltransferase PlsY
MKMTSICDNPWVKKWAAKFSGVRLMLPLAIVASYLLGCVPFAVLVSRALRLPDPRQFGSGNPGATNMMRTGSRRAALLTLVGDAGKGAVAVGLARWLELEADVVVWCGLAAFLGHVFSVFLRFRGGKGVATAGGVLLAIDWRLGGAVIGVWLLAFLATRISSAGALSAALAAPLLAWALDAPKTLLLTALAMSAVLVLRHRSNIRKLIEGSEGRTA